MRGIFFLAFTVGLAYSDFMNDVTTDDFLGGLVRLKQPNKGYRATSDSVLVAAAVRAKHGETILDVGTGTGVIPMCVNARVSGLRFTGVEYQSDLVLLAKENAFVNHCDLMLIEADISKRPSPIHGIQFHHVVTNPPFYTEHGERVHPQEAIAYKQQMPLKDWLDFCLRHLRAKGSFTMIHRTESLPEILSILNGRLGALEVFPIEPKAGTPGKRVIVRGIMNSKKPLLVYPGLVMHKDDDSRTELAERIMRAGQGLDTLIKTS